MAHPPVVDFLVRGHPAQSISEYTSSPLASWRSNSKVIRGRARQYRVSFFKATCARLVGRDMNRHISFAEYVMSGRSAERKMAKAAAPRNHVHSLCGRSVSVVISCAPILAPGVAAPLAPSSPTCSTRRSTRRGSASYSIQTFVQRMILFKQRTSLESVGAGPCRPPMVNLYRSSISASHRSRSVFSPRR